MTRSRSSSSLFFSTTLLAPAVALATPVGGPLVGFGQSMLDFLTGTLGPIVFGIGLAIAAISIVFGSREGLQKAIFTVIGGALLFSVGSVVSFVASISH
jgi:type IV secretory pathway VirB2 component (pilin)